mmetsp:Transcript_45104/g.107213  ORF Transcript_45104/g.107213 Transcript_45104/m.107213 type:complete len:329 (-) Transcript_45104:2-988(-)
MVVVMLVMLMEVLVDGFGRHRHRDWLADDLRLPRHRDLDELGLHLEGVLDNGVPRHRHRNHLGAVRHRVRDLLVGDLGVRRRCWDVVGHVDILHLVHRVVHVFVHDHRLARDAFLVAAVALVLGAPLLHVQVLRDGALVGRRRLHVDRLVVGDRHRHRLVQGHLHRHPHVMHHHLGLVLDVWGTGPVVVLAAIAPDLVRPLVLPIAVAGDTIRHYQGHGAPNVALPHRGSAPNEVPAKTGDQREEEDEAAGEPDHRLLCHQVPLLVEAAFAGPHVPHAGDLLVGAFALPHILPPRLCPPALWVHFGAAALGSHGLVGAADPVLTPSEP